jgi:hypothetical protein
MAVQAFSCRLARLRNETGCAMHAAAILSGIREQFKKENRDSIR